jgi:hypothetical protein
VNPDTGEAETPAHPRAGAWRRDLDNRIAGYERQLDREYEIDNRIAVMTPAEKDALLKVYLQGDKGVAQPTKLRSLRSRLESGDPISRAEARGYRSW